MKRRRLTIEWDDDGDLTPAQQLAELKAGAWDIQDLFELFEELKVEMRCEEVTDE